MEENNNNQENEKGEKECLFSFAKINKYFIIPFLCPVFCIICNYFIEKINEDKGLINKQCFIAIMECSTFLGGGFLYFISSIREKTEETRNKAKTYAESSNSIKLIYNDILQSKKKYFKIFSILFIMSSFISFFDICEVYSFDKIAFEERLFLIFFISIFSYIILKTEIYNHQVLSLSIALIGFILIYIPTILIITKDYICINILFFISSIGFALSLVLIKYLTHIYFLSPYFCLLFIGTVSTLLTFFFFSICSLTTYKDLSFIKNTFDFSNLDIGKWIYAYIVIIFISGAFLQTFSFLVIYYFSPTLFMVTDIMTPFLLWIIKINEEETLSNKIFKGLGYFIVLIASLLYNEIIICNFCSLNKYTKKCLDKRQKEELILMKRTESENSQNSDIDENNNNENDISYNSENDQEVV